MQRFFEELDELKIQQGEAVEPRAKKMKLQQPIDMIEISGAAPMAIPEMGGAMEASGMGHSGELMGGIAGAAIPTVEYDDAPLTKKGGRPKLPLFSVRPNRQKSRTSEVMAYIRKFAVKNQENVDEILWSLLMLLTMSLTRAFSMLLLISLHTNKKNKSLFKNNFIKFEDHGLKPHTPFAFWLHRAQNLKGFKTLRVF